MTEEKTPAPRQPNVIPMIRRIGEVVRTILNLVESVEQLKRKNDLLTQKINELRSELDQQAGQVTVLLDFVRGTLNDKVEQRAEQAARRVLAEFEGKAVRPRKKK